MNEGSQPHGELVIRRVRNNRDRHLLCSFITWYTFNDSMPIGLLLIPAFALALSFPEIAAYFNPLRQGPLELLKTELVIKLALAVVSPLLALVLVPFLAAFQTRRDKQSDYWIVIKDQKLVAYAGITHRQTYSVLHRLYVACAYRHQKIGSALMQRCFNASHDRVYVVVYTSIIKSLSPLPFYIRLGFNPVSKSSSPKEVADSASQLQSTVLVREIVPTAV